MPVEKSRPNTVPKILQQHILVNFIIKSLILRNYNLILVVYNRFLLHTIQIYPIYLAPSQIVLT